MRHIQWTLTAHKNINSVPFPTRFSRHLSRMQTKLKCSYIRNFITRGAGSVVVSASNWQADGPGLTRPDAGGLISLV